MIVKILLLGAALFLVYLVFFKKNREKNIKNKKHDEIVDTMVECPKCSTYVSKDDAILSNGKYFCSKECLS
ncbi:MAG: PP0621 family protein [Arcobacteraceae bacterium]